MEPIKIEQIDRVEAINRCESCKAGLPHLHYYIVAKTKKFKNFGECIEATRQKMESFAATADVMDFHSFNGGKSKTDFLSVANVNASARRVWKEDNYTLSADTLSCHSLNDEHVDEIMSDPDFRGFIKT